MRVESSVLKSTKATAATLRKASESTSSVFSGELRHGVGPLSALLSQFLLVNILRRTYNTMSQRSVVPVILCGGSGTRLWPVSREALPKPFMRVGGKSLLQRTWERSWAVSGVEHAAVVTNTAYAYKAAEELMDEGGSQTISLLLEPFGRNTAPAIALAALWASRSFGPDSVMLVLPADHLVERQSVFLDVVSAAIDVAAGGEHLVLFGITPTAPETGFGYIEWGPALGDTRAHQVTRFVEKPDAATAQSYVAAGNYVWNSGMFCFTAKTILTTMARVAPELMSAAQRVAACGSLDGPQIAFDSERFAELPDISIDYAVMERADNVFVVPCDIGWTDVGNWHAVSNTRPGDELGNVTDGHAIMVNARRTYVRSEGRIVAAVGVEDLVVVDTADAVLVAHKSATQDVKEVVRRLRDSGHDAYRFHTTVHRPWGSFTTVEEADGYKIKRIVVKPGHALSLQYHRHRAEHWVVVSGEAVVQIGDREFVTHAGESRYIARGERHRLSNRTASDLELIEVQCGAYLGEDDIVRLEDRYGRA